MTASAIDGDFTACDTAMLNKFFADYLKDHTREDEHAAAEPGAPVRVA
jgi:molybdopterin-guanine dinucleotide biosynthesis protein A